ncbi:MAG TPA: CoA-binding protein, partial [Streptosporangiaceae bacterium]|nr:CoA-binding protein [Streptosporangiaceae bacterium]
MTAGLVSGGQPGPARAGPARAGPAQAAVSRPARARSGLESMLAARSVALVGASPRPGTFGARMIEEVTRSPSRPRVHLVNPRYAEIGGRRCLPSL